MSRIGKIIDSMPPEQQKTVLELREKHSCLVELDRKVTIALQTKAIYLDYMASECRRLDSKPHYYEDTDGKGGTIIRETYFTYLLKVK